MNAFLPGSAAGGTTSVTATIIGIALTLALIGAVLVQVRRDRVRELARMRAFQETRHHAAHTITPTPVRHSRDHRRAGARLVAVADPATGSVRAGASVERMLRRDSERVVLPRCIPAPGVVATEAHNSGVTS